MQTLKIKTPFGTSRPFRNRNPIVTRIRNIFWMIIGIILLIGSIVFGIFGLTESNGNYVLIAGIGFVFGLFLYFVNRAGLRMLRRRGF